MLILVVAFAWLLLQASAFRRNLVLLGGDDRLAFTAGIRVAGMRVGVYMISGAVAAHADLSLTFATLGSGDPTVGAYYLLVSFAGVALGGVSLIGGRGGMLGAAAGGAILFLIQNLLTVDQVSTFHQQIAEGVILLLALAINSLALRMRQRRYRAVAGYEVHRLRGRLSLLRDSESAADPDESHIEFVGENGNDRGVGATRPSGCCHTKGCMIGSGEGVERGRMNGGREMRIAVIGAGAMGSIFAARFTQGGHDVTLVDVAAPLVEHINAEGVAIVRDDEETVTQLSTSDPSATGAVDIGRLLRQVLPHRVGGRGGTRTGGLGHAGRLSPERLGNGAVLAARLPADRSSLASRITAGL